jgi:tetratricopeptide (TPR) repeat protein
MSMLKPPRTAPRPKKQEGEGAEEAISTAYVRTRTFIEEYRAVLIAAAVGIAVIFLATLGYFYWQHGQIQQANELLGQALPAYERGDFEAALEGDGSTLGLVAIAEEYRRTPAGKLASFYAGHAYFHLERFDEAERFFARYRGDEMLEASALAGRAAAAEQRGEHAAAARLFNDAARAYPVPATAPDYLLNAARNFEAAGDFSAARRAYQRIAEDYAQAPLAEDVPIYLARLDAMAEAR